MKNSIREKSIIKLRKELGSLHDKHKEAKDIVSNYSKEIAKLTNLIAIQDNSLENNVGKCFKYVIGNQKHIAKIADLCSISNNYLSLYSYDIYSGFYLNDKMHNFTANLNVQSIPYWLECENCIDNAGVFYPQNLKNVQEISKDEFNCLLSEMVREL